MNCPRKDIFGTKGQTLEALASLIHTATVLPQIIVSRKEWLENEQNYFKNIFSTEWINAPLAVRSSFLGEDGKTESKAGLFDTKLGVCGQDELNSAINALFGHKDSSDDADQIIVQPFITDPTISGVAFTYDPNSQTPYYVINFSERSGDTTIVTSGTTNDLQTFICSRSTYEVDNLFLNSILKLLHELEEKTALPTLDVEFTVSKSLGLVLLQARPLTGISQGQMLNPDTQDIIISAIEKKIEEAARPHPDLFGKKAIFGIMPDWNPAEIIGVRPMPLALSLYGKLITDENWAYQRDNYGYRNLRSFPLMKNFFGLPYIDVRVSFNSFLPKTIPDELAKKLVEYYLKKLRDHPSSHDKVEFDIIHSCCHFSLRDRLAELTQYGFSKKECKAIFLNLRNLTSDIVNNDTNLWKSDLERFTELKDRREKLLQSGLSNTSKVYWLLEYCERYGAVPFAGIARAAFISAQLLESLVNCDIWSPTDLMAFYATIDTVSSELHRDFIKMDRQTFLSKYGHLRPGTYDIRLQRYDECPDEYFDWEAVATKSDIKSTLEYQLSSKHNELITAKLKRYGLKFSVEKMFEFIRATITGREYGKFVFTESLSDALSMFKDICAKNGFSAEDACFADIECIRSLYNGSEPVKSVLARSIAAGRAKYNFTKNVSLPPLITEPADARAFYLPPERPNFITNRQASGPVILCTTDRSTLPGGILFIPNADPGFDWIFSTEINGFITQYGGVNSHMAIRANELGIPAVIGAGERFFTEWSKASFLFLDASNQIVRPLA
jgi:phosphohistidine swiveling domain-containing protein